MLQLSDLSLTSRIVGEHLIQGTDVGLSDRDVLAMVFAYADNRLDAIKVAAEVFKRFGSISSVMSADASDLLVVPGMTQRATAFVKFLQLIRMRVLREPLVKQTGKLPIGPIVAYCCARFASLKVEEVHVLFLDQGNALICDDRIAVGTTNRCAVYIDVVIRRALELKASAIVLTHNHPSGEPEPSIEDLEVTARIGQACALLNINFADHIIVAGFKYISMRERGLMKIPNRLDDISSFTHLHRQAGR